MSMFTPYQGNNKVTSWQEVTVGKMSEILGLQFKDASRLLQIGAGALLGNSLGDDNIQKAIGDLVKEMHSTEVYTRRALKAARQFLQYHQQIPRVRGTARQQNEKRIINETDKKRSPAREKRKAENEQIIIGSEKRTHV